MKYIIKNCDCFKVDACLADKTEKLYCKDIPDCLIKRIVDKCIDIASDEDCCGYDFAKGILEPLEIEEV